MSLRLVCVNVERSKHLDRVMPFLGGAAADAVCIQELCERDIPLFESSLGMPCTFAPVCPHPADAPESGFVQTGVGLFAPEAEVVVEYYKGSREQAVQPPIRFTATDAPLIVADVAHDGVSYRIATTHFTWTPDGKPTDMQRTDMRALLELVSMKGDLALCGDFNAPRGGEVFSLLASRFTDNIPPQYETSLDVQLHRSAAERKHELLDKMVDGLFTTPGYAARDVELHFGISDHAAITATIEKA